MNPARGVARTTAGTIAPRGLVVPAYFHPAVAAADWRRLAAAGRSVQAVILNAADGPGTTPERELTAAAVATGRPLYGYVDTGYGRRRLADVHADVDRWRHWYPTGGIFLDRVATGVRALPWYERLVSYVRRGGPGVVVLNHGAHPHPGYAVIADAMVTFEGPYAAHRRIEVPDWVRGWPAASFWHLVYGTPESLMGSALESAAEANAGVVYVTDRSGRNPWDGLPSYLAAEARTWAG
jgi:Spherulation-specific family 4